MKSLKNQHSLKWYWPKLHMKLRVISCVSPSIWPFEDNSNALALHRLLNPFWQARKLSHISPWLWRPLASSPLTLQKLPMCPSISGPKIHAHAHGAARRVGCSFRSQVRLLLLILLFQRAEIVWSCKLRRHNLKVRRRRWIRIWQSERGRALQPWQSASLRPRCPVTPLKPP